MFHGGSFQSVFLYVFQGYLPWNIYKLLTLTHFQKLKVTIYIYNYKYTVTIYIYILMVFCKIPESISDGVTKLLLLKINICRSATWIPQAKEMFSTSPLEAADISGWKAAIFWRLKHTIYILYIIYIYIYIYILYIYTIYICIWDIYIYIYEIYIYIWYIYIYSSCNSRLTCQFSQHNQLISFTGICFFIQCFTHSSKSFLRWLGSWWFINSFPPAIWTHLNVLQVQKWSHTRSFRIILLHSGHGSTPPSLTNLHRGEQHHLARAPCLDCLSWYWWRWTRCQWCWWTFLRRSASRNARNRWLEGGLYMGLKMLCTPLYPMVNDHYPYISLLNGYFIGKINPTFSDKPTCWSW